MSETTFPIFDDQTKTFRMIPYVKQFFIDTITPIEVFRKLEREAVFLLESKDEASPWSRYSFIGLSPRYRIIETRKTYRFLDAAQNVLLEDRHLPGIFQKVMDWLRPGDPHVDLPFKGGAVGVVPYDTVEKFRSQLSSPYHENEKERVTLLFCETLIAFDHVTKELTFIHYNSNEMAASNVRYKESQAKVNQYMHKIIESKQDYSYSRPMMLQKEVDFKKVCSNYSKEKFEQDVRTIQSYIETGEIDQAVLSQRFEREITVSGFDIYRALRMINPSPYLFYLKLEKTEVVGSSPERLIQVKNRQMEIHPIAGTRKRGKSDREDQQLAQDLLQDKKEIAEHQMLVDLAKEDIAKVAEKGTIETPTLFEIGKFSHVMHIISKVTGKLAATVQPIEALASAFPAGTVSGAPKERALEILNQLEKEPRGIYAGAVCYIDFAGNIDSCIAIRTVVIENDRAKVQAGAGIVKDSIPEKEYEETKNKAMALLTAIEAAEVLFGNKEEEREHV
ncbi:anthranilate synthase component I [Aliibacillus thermotolerans]|uniref:Anthranilate synthase component 1 n=1 Tax=Aliibacillus thermotolerans TaxID=1834418 RepID=A0ABW0U7W3_9BACI|nr:anthranilate synthase component I [Aliibacillus thermotolerans]MDA3130190.1 anthranilate synthase component I [Aliibacillus thermotolerans]